MSEPGRVCACGGRELLEGELFCPACERSRHGLGSRLVQAGQNLDVGVVGSLAGGLFGRLAAGARAGVEAARPVIEAGVAEAKAHGAPLVDAAMERAKVEGKRAALEAISRTEGVLERAKGWLGGRRG